MYIMLLSLMIFLGRPGYISSRAKMKYSTNLRNSKPSWRITQKRKSRPFDKIMVENSHQKNSRNYAKIQGLRGS